MNQTRERLYDIEKNGYQLDFANVFNHAFENYKKIALYAGLILIVFTILLSIFAMGTAITIFGLQAITDNLKPENLKPENFSSSFLIIYSVSIILLSCLLSPFQAGFLKMADCGEKDEEFHVSTLFTYYHCPYLKEIVLLTFIIASVGLLQTTLFSLIHLELLGMLITYILSFLTFLSIPLVIFGNLKAIEAIKYSILIVWKQPFVLLGLLIVAIIASMVGLIGCCIGVFFTLPFLYSMNYSIYSAIVGIDMLSEKDVKGSIL